mmetsp:Transcript_44435/g.105273  ORF Transcript_44435/g.105273 Transcript_44435/m.105273 type:complete len:317 (-) Transcript_44435:480-1430(-)
MIRRTTILGSFLSRFAIWRSAWRRQTKSVVFVFKVCEQPASTVRIEACIVKPSSICVLGKVLREKGVWLVSVLLGVKKIAEGFKAGALSMSHLLTHGRVTRDPFGVVDVNSSLGQLLLKFIHRFRQVLLQPVISKEEVKKAVVHHKWPSRTTKGLPRPPEPDLLLQVHVKYLILTLLPSKSLRSFLAQLAQRHCRGSTATQRSCASLEGEVLLWQMSSYILQNTLLNFKRSTCEVKSISLRGEDASRIICQTGPLVLLLLRQTRRIALTILAIGSPLRDGVCDELFSWPIHVWYALGHPPAKVHAIAAHEVHCISV